MEGLSRVISRARSHGTLKGYYFKGIFYIMHLLFIDDILIFSDGSRRDIIKLFQAATGMVMNPQKSSLSSMNLKLEVDEWIKL